MLTTHKTKKNSMESYQYIQVFLKQREKEWIKNRNTEIKTAQEQQLEMTAAVTVANCRSTIKPNDDKLCVGCKYC